MDELARVAILNCRVAPREGALTKASLLGQSAAKHDGWMTPCIDEIKATDLSQATLESEGEWEATTHFQDIYANRLLQMAQEEADGVYPSWEDQPDCTMIVYEQFYQPLKDAFWEAWEDGVGFADKFNNKGK